MTITNSWVPTTEAFGARLALVRHRMGWNISEAAQACGLSESNWRGWELQGRQPHKFQKVAEAISTVTGVDPVWLMMGKPQPSDYKATDSSLVRHVKPTATRTRPTRRTKNTGPKGRA